jgi:hypothetical protein
MKAKVTSLILLALFVILYNSSAQVSVKISKPTLEIQDNKLIINYDILHSKQSERFNIWIEVTDTAGNIVEAKSLGGDVGENITGGNNKKIVWNLEADNINLEIGIYIEVNAEISVIPEVSETISQQRTLKRSNVILQSIVFPGLGLSRIKQGKPHWLKGVMGYGCIATSFIYNRKAVSSYDDYLSASDPKKIDEYYDNSVKQDNLSEVFIYAAIGVWVADIIWTVVGSSDMKKDPNISHMGGFSIGPSSIPYSKIPVVALKYNF